MTFAELRERQEAELAELRGRQIEEERAFLRGALEGAAWSLSAAARAIGAPVSTLQTRLERVHRELDAERRRH